MLPLFGNIAFAQMRVKAIRDDYRHADHAEGFADRASLQRCPGFAEHLSADERRAYLLADNRLALESGWDREILALELKELDALEFNLPALGFSLPEIDKLYEDLADKRVDGTDPEDDALPIPAARIVTQPDDLWLLGNHRLVQGDAREVLSYERLLDDEKIDVVFADPPYNVRIENNVSGLGKVRHGDFAMASGEMSPEQFTDFLTEGFRPAADRMRTIMRRYVASTSANQLVAQLEAEGIRTKVQQRTSGPHKGGIPFKRGSLFHLLANPIYRGNIVHKGKVYDGEHEAIVDEGLWNAVQARLQQKAPPRKRKSNDPLEAMLRGLITDPEGRPMLPTYTKKGTRLYTYYETRKDLAAKPEAAPPTRVAQSAIERHLISHLATLLDDEPALRRLAGLQEAGQLTTLFEAARLRGLDLAHPATRDETARSLVASIALGASSMCASINLVALGLDGEVPLELPLPERKPFREAKLRIDSSAIADRTDRKLIGLIAEAMEVRELVQASPELSLNQLGKRDGRCRTQLGRLLRLSWLSPRIIEAIIDGRQPTRLNRKHLLEADLPICWSAQGRLLGFAA